VKNIFYNKIFLCALNRVGLKGTLVYSLDHRVLAQNMTLNDAIIVNMNGDNTLVSEDILAMDVDANKKTVYWLNSQFMYRAALPQEATQLAYVQTLRGVNSGSGVSCDWITG